MPEGQGSIAVAANAGIVRRAERVESVKSSVVQVAAEIRVRERSAEVPMKQRTTPRATVRLDEKMRRGRGVGGTEQRCPNRWAAAISPRSR